MSALPWDVTELATKDDLRLVESRLEAAIDRSKWTIVVSLVTINATLAGLALAFVQLVT